MRSLVNQSSNPFMNIFDFFFYSSRSPIFFCKTANMITDLNLLAIIQ
ncbi:hypothetical protein DSUL_20510 [Desulfovibrionales bacterium]